MGRIFGFAMFCLEISGFSQTTGPTDPVYVLITQGVFLNAGLKSLVDLF